VPALPNGGGACASQRPTGGAVGGSPLQKRTHEAQARLGKYLRKQCALGGELCIGNYLHPVEETFAEVWVDSEAVGSTSSSLDIA
jgi:hypothetical protein